MIKCGQESLPLLISFVSIICIHTNNCIYFAFSETSSAILELMKQII